MELNRRIWEEGSINRSVCGDEYDRVCDIAEQLESSLAEAREEIERATETLDTVAIRCLDETETRASLLVYINQHSPMATKQCPTKPT